MVAAKKKVVVVPPVVVPQVAVPRVKEEPKNLGKLLTVKKVVGGFDFYYENGKKFMSRKEYFK